MAIFGRLIMWSLLSTATPCGDPATRVFGSGDEEFAAGQPKFRLAMQEFVACNPQRGTRLEANGGSMRRLIALVVVLSPVASARADVDPVIKAAIAKIKPADYPSSNVVVLLDDQAVVYQSDGQFANTIHIARLVLTPAGKQDVATMSWPYAKDGEKVEVLSAQVVKKDGSVVRVAKSDIQDTEQGGEENIYDPNGRVVKITFAGVAVGDAVDATLKLVRETPTRIGFFDDIFTFQSTEPIIEASYKVDGPAALPLVAQV